MLCTPKFSKTCLVVLGSVIFVNLPSPCPYTCARPARIAPRNSEGVRHCILASHDEERYLSWPSSPPHWLSRRRNTGHVKPPSPCYFVNFRCLYRSNSLIDKTLATVDRFSRALAISVFDSPWMHCFCGALTSLFYVLLNTFHFLLVFYCSLYSSLIFTWP